MAATIVCLRAGCAAQKALEQGERLIASGQCRFPFKLSLLILQLAPLTLSSCHQPSALPVSGQGGSDLLLCRELEDGLARRRRNSFARTAHADLPNYFFLFGPHLMRYTSRMTSAIKCLRRASMRLAPAGVPRVPSVTTSEVRRGRQQAIGTRCAAIRQAQQMRG